VNALLTQSRLKAYQTCPELHFFQYVKGWRPAKQADALTFGSAFHLGAECYNKMQEIPAYLLDDPYENARVQALLHSYLCRWQQEDAARHSVLAVELPFDLPLTHPVTGQVHPHFRLAGKIDLITERLDNREREVTDHKTSGEDFSPGSVFWRRLDLDLQNLLYLHAARELGYDARRFVYDVVAKPRQRPKKGETPGAFGLRIMEQIAEAPADYFARSPMDQSDGAIERALIDVWDFADRIHRDIAEGWHPRATSACFKWGRACPFLGVCCGLEDLAGGGFVQSDEVNPELAETA
jgi:hypothetical protein